MPYIGKEPARVPVTASDIPDDSITAAKILDGVITAADLAANSVDSSELVDGSIDTSHIGALQVTTAKIAADAVDGTKIADDAIDSEHIAADSIDAEHYAAGSVDTTALGADAVTGAKIADDAIDSEHYVDASIDNAHLADDAVGVAELSATGTASSSTFLRGDNSWATVTSVGGATGADFNDNVKLRFGTGNDLEIYHSGSNSMIRDTGTGGIYIEATNFYVTNAAGSENMIGAIEDGAVNLYYNSDKKFETDSEGVDITGIVKTTASGAAGYAPTQSGIQVRQNAYSGYVSGMNAMDTAATTNSNGFIGFMGATHTGAGERHIVFATRPGTTDAVPTERMRIDSDGQVMIGTTNNTSVLGVSSADTSNYAVTINGARASGGTGYMVDFHENSFAGNRMGTITSNGGSIAYNTTSDYRLKENVDYDFDATTRLKQLKPARFNWIADDTNTLVDGFLAHEVSSIVPEAVSGEKDAMRTEEYEITPEVIAIFDDDGNITTEPVEAVMGEREVIAPQGIDQAKLVPLLVKTIQELEARITALES